MASAPNFWLTKTGMLILAASCVAALFLALVVVPAIARSAAIDSAPISMTLGVVFFVITVCCYIAARVFNKKKAAE